MTEPDRNTTAGEQSSNRFGAHVENYGGSPDVWVPPEVAEQIGLSIGDTATIVVDGDTAEIVPDTNDT